MGMKSACFLSFTPFPLSFTAVQAPNSQNKMRDHRNYKDRNAENASYIHAQRDAVKPVSLNAPSYSRPMNSSYIKGNVNKEPKPNRCPGEVHYLHNLLMSIVCIPMEFLDGPTDLHCYPTSLLFGGHHHHNILEN